ncbi:AlwI family type II restriction endonuclease [bacterium]|nr:AlwI family type II restriction endonuclease [bacterium]
MWSLVPKPRSAIKTVEWFPSFAKLEGRNWNTQLPNGNHPIRREYLNLAHPYEQYSRKDPEVNARMEFARFQTLGLAFLEEDGTIRITEAGRTIVFRENKSEILLRQLLKWQFPSNIHRGNRYKGLQVFPLQLIINVLDEFNTLNKYEIALSVFGCTSMEDIEIAKKKVYEFRQLIDSNEIDKNRIFLENMASWNPKLKNKPETYLDYSDVLFRYLEFTGIFATSGRGNLTRVFIPERSRIKFNQLFSDYNFQFIDDYEERADFYNKFGSLDFSPLPWDDKSNLASIVQNKLSSIEQRGEKVELGKSIDAFDYQELQELDEVSEDILLRINEKQFVEELSKTKEGRQEIIGKFEDILHGNEDDATRWFEVNTWKSLVAISGTHYVKRNFKIEYDLSPRSFAPGTGNTPDMEFYNSEYIIIPEVSTQSGVSQWISEGSSVVDHVNKFVQIRQGTNFNGIEEIQGFLNEKNIKNIFGLFLCLKINERLLWQFYILCKESWLGEPVPIIPLELEEYLQIIQHIYINESPALKFEQFLGNIVSKANSTSDYKEWRKETKSLIAGFVDA